MATYIDRITDGAMTVDLAGGDFKRLRFSYAQQIADRDEFGRYRPVTEQWRVNWTGRNEGDRALTLRLLMQLQRKAREWASGRRAAGPVWREVATTSEGALRYAIVTDIRVPTLDGRAYAPARSGVPADIAVTREGAWRDRPPLVAGDVVVDAVATYTYEVGVSKNYIDIEPGKFDGDAEALVDILIDAPVAPTLIDTRFLIALKTADNYADLSPVQVGFNAVDATGLASYLSADASAPGGQVAIVPAATVTSAPFFGWDLPAQAPYDGEYLVFLHARAVNGDELIEARLYDPQPGDWTSVPVAASGQYSRVFLGRLRLPADRIHARYEYASSTYPFNVELRHPPGSAATSDVRIRDLYLVPVDEGVVTAVRDAYIPMTLIDGTLYDDVYMLNASQQIQYNTGYMIGRSLTLKPGRYNRLFFYQYGVNNDWTRDGDMTEFKQHVLNSVDLTVNVVSRYVAVRAV